MGALLEFVGDWGHALAAVLFAALGISVLRRQDETAGTSALPAALLLTACWALTISFGGVAQLVSGLSESVRNAAWLLLMFVLLRRRSDAPSSAMVAIVAVYAAVAGLLLFQAVADMVGRQMPPESDLHRALIAVSLVLRMMTAVGGLLLAHHLFMDWPPAARSRISLLLGALAAMWTYDLNLYAFAYFAPQRVQELYALRGLMMALLAPVIAIGARKDLVGRLRLSRTLTFRSLSLAAATLYVILLSAAAVVVELVAGPLARMIEIGFVFFMAVTALVLLPSPQMRAFWKVQVVKHFFKHRYDYRSEWMRFGETIGRSGEQAAPLGERSAKAVADITGSAGAILLLRAEDGSLAFETQWNWPAMPADPIGLDAGQAGVLERTGWIVDIDGTKEGDTAFDLPAWIAHDPQAWALAPLLHFGKLTGALLLARPPLDRRLDWEDFDMLRAAGRQVATYLSEAQGQQALDDARRFDEFNRRFAFIIHDVKNLVSQLSLLARNAERHAENPAFRADMVLTLNESVGKLNDLLARLSQHNKARAEEPRAVALDEIVRRVARGRARQHPVDVTGDAPLAMADPARFELVLAHLVQNAIEASLADSPIELRLSSDGADVLVEVIDMGVGMTPDFVRRELFKPFSSSKAGGFGIGAFEARTLVQAMGGRIDVESRPGAGSRFMIRLPRADRTQIEKAGEAA
jgi:putative PEP-CTERM system histidine kinase